MGMTIALYRGNKTLLDKSINRLSGNKGFSHAELVFSDGWCFSSTARDPGLKRNGARKPNGTRWKKIEFDPGKWAFAPAARHTGSRDLHAGSRRHAARRRVRFRRRRAVRLPVA